MPKEYITNACDLCKESENELIGLLKELLHLYRDEFPKCKTFLSKDRVGETLACFCRINESLDDKCNESQCFQALWLSFFAFF